MNLPRASIGNPVAVNLLMWFIVIIGAYYWFDLVREFFPSLSTEQISISIAYPGATPEDVERAITLRVERKTRDIDGIDEISSTVLEGMSVILIKLDADADKQRILNEIRSDIDQVKADFPTEADDPEIIEVRPYVPVVSLVISGDVPEERLRTAALRVKDDILDLGGISEVNMLGRRSREIWANVRPEKLDEHGLTFDEVGRAVASGNLDIPGGQLKSSSGNVRLRTMGEQRKALALESLVVDSRPDGTAVRLRDVADVEETFEDRVMRGRFAGAPAISLVIFKTPEQDALKIATKVKRYAAENPTRLGGAIKLDITTDLSRFIEQRLDLMLRNARAGLILVVLALALFLSLRTAFWVAVGLPISLLGAFALMSWMGASINLLSLFSLIVVLGLIVDDAVVIGESVHTRLQRGDPPDEAAWKGASEVALPVLAAVMTSMIAFAPMAFMKGMWGDFMSVLPIDVCAALLVSLIEAFVILPSHLAHGGRRSETTGGTGLRGLSRRLARLRERWLDERPRFHFERLLRTILRWRYPALATSLAVLLAISGLLAGGVVPFVLMQDVDAESVTVTVEMAAGTSEDRTIEVIAGIERLASGYDEVATVFSVVGTSFSDRGQNTPSDPATVGQLFVELLPADERELRGMQSSQFIIEEMRRETLFIPGVSKLGFRAENGGAQGSDIELRVRNEELELASRAADRVKSMLLEYEGVTELEKDLSEGKLEARVTLRDSARPLGLTTQALASQLRHALFGFEAQELQEEDDEMKVRVLLPEAARRELSDLGRLRIKTPSGARVPLDEVCDIHTERGYANLRRVDGKRAVTVRAEVDETIGNVQTITTSMAGRLRDIDEEFPGTSVTFEGQQKETRESFGSLAIGFPVALFAIYALIAILFRSYAQPLIVMAVIPFSLVGAVLGHMLMGFPFTLLSMIGAVALAGIVVNDSLILVDKVNRNRRDGMPLTEAVVQGATSRLRAIILTTITTAAGLFPLMLERSFQAQFLIPMAISIVFGLLFATVVTLLVLPTLYLLFEDVRSAFRWLRTGSVHAKSEGTPA